MPRAELADGLVTNNDAAASRAASPERRGDVEAGRARASGSGSGSTRSSRRVMVGRGSRRASDSAGPGAEPVRRPREHILMGALMSSADGSPTIKYRAMQTLVLTFAIFGGLAYNNVCALAAKMDGPNSLLDLATGLFTGGVVVGLFVLDSARVALQPDGALQALCEHVKPSDSEVVARTVQRWRVALGIFSGVFVLLGGWWLASGFAALIAAPTVWTLWVELCLIGLSFIVIFPVLISGWWASMSIGSCLCRDAVNEVIKKAKVTDPAAEDGSEWHAGVAAPALALRKTLNMLSDGWSRGMVALAGWMWLIAVASFAMAVNKTFTDGYDNSHGRRPDYTRDLWFVIAATFAAVPMLLALDLAVTGQRCHKLMFELNEAGIRHGRGAPDGPAPIHRRMAEHRLADPQPEAAEQGQRPRLCLRAAADGDRPQDARQDHAAALRADHHGLLVHGGDER